MQNITSFFQTVVMVTKVTNFEQNTKLIGCKIGFGTHLSQRPLLNNKHPILETMIYTLYIFDVSSKTLNYNYKASRNSDLGLSMYKMWWGQLLF